MNKLILSLLIILFLVGCSGRDFLDTKFGKKCIKKENTIVYSYVWLHKKGTVLSADAKTCDLIKKEGV